MRLRTLIVLRWLAIIGQLAAVLVAAIPLSITFPLQLCLLTVAVSATFNLVATIIYPANKRLTQNGAMLTLVFDLCQLCVLLYLTGGLSNPFAVLVLAPVSIAATALTLRATLVLGGVAIALTTLLALFNQPLVLADGTTLQVPLIYIEGMWIALLIAIVFLGAYARRVTVEAFSMSQALSATQMALAREQQLTALGGVVAAAAHEMGTPLATIKLVTSELEAELEDNLEILEDVRLIQSQAERCRNILRDMGRSGRDDALVRIAPLSAVVSEAAEPHLHRGKRVITRIDGAPVDEADLGDEPDIPRHPEIIHGLRNLVQNAVDFSRSTVWIDMSWDADHVTVCIGDNGIGYPLDLINRIGDPFVGKRRKTGADRQRPGYDGMGLGLFIAKTLLERSGAALAFANGRKLGKPRPRPEDVPPDEFAQPIGALVEVTWRRRDLEASRDATRGPLGRNQLNLP